jgi:hypothetical protein
MNFCPLRKFAFSFASACGFKVKNVALFAIIPSVSTFRARQGHLPLALFELKSWSLSRLLVSRVTVRVSSLLWCIKCGIPN